MHIFKVTRNSLLSSLPSFDVVNMGGETGREGNMVHRAERRRRSARARRYWAGGGAQGAGECWLRIILHNFCR